MQAWAIRKFGGPEVLALVELPRPEPGPDDVVVDVRAASVNPVDWKIRSGGLKAVIRYRFPLVLGNDCSGVVAAVGANVTRFKVGDAVFGRVDKHRIGTFADAIAVPAAALARKPERLGHGEAASVALVGLTAWQAMVDIAPVEPGHKVLVPAGAGGVGTFAIQLAKHLGATVATTASPPKHELLAKLGADQIIDYRSQDFAAVVSGCDLVLDTLGGADLVKAFGVVKRGGAVVSIAGPPDPAFAAEWRLHPVVRLAIRLMSWPTRRRARRAGVRYRYLFMRADGDELARIAALLESGAIRPVIDRVFPFAQADQAIAYAEAGRATGKVVIARDG